MKRPFYKDWKTSIFPLITCSWMGTLVWLSIVSEELCFACSRNLLSCRRNFIHQKEFPSYNKKGFFWCLFLTGIISSSIWFPTATGNISCNRNFICQQEFLSYNEIPFWNNLFFPAIGILLLQQEISSCERNSFI